MEDGGWRSKVAVTLEVVFLRVDEACREGAFDG